MSQVHFYYFFVRGGHIRHRFAVPLVNYELPLRVRRWPSPSPHRSIFRMNQRLTANVTHVYVCLPIIQVSLACKMSRYLCLTAVVVLSFLTYLLE